MFCRYGGAVLAALACLCASLHADDTKRFELKVENGRLLDAPKSLRVNRGDNVEIQWATDRLTAIHVHGYDILVTLDASQPRTMSFRARATGRFPIETHGNRGGQHHQVLIYLEVYPR